MGKVNPYVKCILHGSNSFETPVIKNSRSPVWEHVVEQEVEMGKDTRVTIKVYDKNLPVGTGRLLGDAQINIPSSCGPPRKEVKRLLNVQDDDMKLRHPFFTMIFFFCFFFLLNLKYKFEI